MRGYHPVTECFVIDTMKQALVYEVARNGTLIIE